MFDKILVPLDGSARAEEIFSYLRPILKRGKSELMLATACTEVPMGGRAAMVTYEKSRDRDKQYLESMQHRLVTEGMKVRLFQPDGAPATALLDLAAQEHVSLIATTTHGRTGLKRWTFGSVAEKLLRSSPVPVLVVRPADLQEPETSPENLPRAAPFRKILVPTDGSEASMAVVPQVRELARLLKAKVVVFRVEEPVLQPAGASAAPPALESRPAADIVAGHIAEGGVSASALIHHGEDPAAAIADFGKRNGFDLIALSTHGRSGFSRWMLGSVTEKVLRATTLPLLVVRPKGT